MRVLKAVGVMAAAIYVILQVLTPVRKPAILLDHLIAENLEVQKWHPTTTTTTTTTTNIYISNTLGSGPGLGLSVGRVL